MQNYKNHRRYYPLHHYVITPLSLITLSLALWILAEAYAAGSDLKPGVFYAMVSLSLFLLPIMSRIYALKTQNRIIRMEMRLRYFQLTGKPFYQLEKKLSLAQIIALRFAGSKELVPLIEKTVRENLPPRQIKKAIKDWQGDYLRV
ncbi:hypothetical protein SAMN04488057_1075 [Cyclobacterium lianum]|uniref:Uncharacterized protein n=1 Tax=Cyclobacterium lianum TaxID=388280 RepID=A0A1M7P4P7_9BACT|nr:DUF6526 family protein [Cyclobacterium lianum]SHN11474.1 hypothetical protein SAMN04488057_1075 [Cyclobacterium lianum]